MHNKVFISYAKEDYLFAEKLYDFLEESNYQPWLDKKKILPGQDWNFVIKKALREANYIILLLSNVSIQKRGYIQREFKLALEFYEEKLEDDIYLIPLKTDDCNIPESLQKFQWIEYSSEDCFNRVLTSLNIQRQKYLELEKRMIISKEIFSFKEFREKMEYAAKKKVDINIGYFQFEDETNPSLKELNTLIKGKIIENVISFRKEVYEITGEFQDLYSSLDWLFEIDLSPNLITNSIVSINQNIYGYMGGAHGNNNIVGLNFHINPLFQIEIQDLFEYEDHPKVLDFLSKYCRRELIRGANEWISADAIEDSITETDSIFWKDSLTPKWENFNKFFISKSGLEIIFNTYSVSGYAFGFHTVSIPYEKFLHLLKMPNKIIDLSKKIGFITVMN